MEKPQLQGADMGLSAMMRSSVRLRATGKASLPSGRFPRKFSSAGRPVYPRSADHPRILETTPCTPSVAYAHPPGCCLLSAGRCLLPTAYCLLPTAFCLLPSAC